MSDNIRTALYDADYTVALASRRLDRRADARPGRRQALRERRHRRHDAWLPADLAPGDLLAVPATGAYCRSMASNYNHVPRPPVVAVPRRQGAGSIVRRETEDDLLASTSAEVSPDVADRRSVRGARTGSC